MSLNRLDDELQKAFAREQPSADFTMRVLDRVALEPAPRQPWWKKLALLLEPPKLRWVAIGVTASLLLAVGAMQYSRMRQVAVDDSVKVANVDSVKAGGDDAANHPNERPVQNSMNNKPAPGLKLIGSSSTGRRITQTRHNETRELQAEGAAAKETLMLALSIASSALSDAQKAVHEDGLRP